jgi:hypothetical protein
MKTILIVLGFILVLASAACGGAPQTASSSLPESLPGRGAIRLTGVGPLAADSVKLDVESVELTCDGQPLPSLQREMGPYELTRYDHAWLLALFDMPASGVIHVKVKLAPKGAFGHGGAALDIDARNLTVEFDAPVAAFENARHAVIHLDLAKSLHDCAGSKVLLPQLRVLY